MVKFRKRWFGLKTDPSTTFMHQMFHVATADLRNLAHFIYVRLLLLKLSEGRLDGSNGRVVVGDRAHGREPTGVVEPGNVDGRRRRGDYHRSRRRAGRARCGRR